MVDELFRIYEIRSSGRGYRRRSSIVVTFRRDPAGSPPIGRERSSRVRRRAWIDEEDRQVVRAEAECSTPFLRSWSPRAPLQVGDGVHEAAQGQRRGVAPGELASTARRAPAAQRASLDSLSEYWIQEIQRGNRHGDRDGEDGSVERVRLVTADSNIPRIQFANLFEEDGLGERFFAWWMGPAFRDVREHFFALGESGALATPLSAGVDKASPVLQTHDARGERISRVVHHPDAHRLESSLRSRHRRDQIRRGFPGANRAFRHLVGFGAAYYFAQTEMGLFCPLHEDGVARVLELSGSGPLVKETIERLTTRMSRALAGAMFLTERQGGSDVGPTE